MSDLHLEFEYGADPDDAGRPGAMLRPSIETALAPAAGADLVVLAGDIHGGLAGIAQADAISRFTDAPVVYVAGNHEAYGHDLAALLPRMRAAAWATDGRVLFLECNLARLWLGGLPLAVLGCTLWTDYAIHGDEESAMHFAARDLRDHQLIGWNGGMFLPADALALHRKHRAWLEAQMRKLKVETPRPEILIVTHHAPCPVAVGHRARVLAPAYASDMLTEIADWAPVTWIHGHAHHRHLTRIGAATIASAPRGYPGEPATSTPYVCGILTL